MNHYGRYNSRVTYFYLLSGLSVYIFLTSLIKPKKTKQKKSLNQPGLLVFANSAWIKLVLLGLLKLEI